ncbi:MAG: hypothetical protein H6711_11045 [Myxococcales bacterium]|nr:hypothetical protein [Myxococcales bacterium]
MGYRAHLLIREGGATRLHASHAGGRCLVRDLLHGPAIYGAYVESTDVVDDLYYEDAVDAVALVDRDRRALVWWGGDNLPIESVPGLRRRYEALLRGCWPGWEVRWEPGGIRAIADALAVPFAVDAAAELRVRALVDDGFARDEAPTMSVITVLDADGAGHDVGSGWTVESLLTLGARLVDDARARRAAPLPREAIPDPDDQRWADQGGLVIDPARRRIECWWNWPSPRRVDALPLLARFWPGWTLALAVDGAVVHADRSGRARDLVELPIAEAAAALELRLFAEHEFDPPPEAPEALAQRLSELRRAPRAALTDNGLPPPSALQGQIARRLGVDA